MKTLFKFSLLAFLFALVFTSNAQSDNLQARANTSATLNEGAFIRSKRPQTATTASKDSVKTQLSPARKALPAKRKPRKQNWEERAAPAMFEGDRLPGEDRD